MGVIINPGSGPIVDGPEWTNTYEKARATAEEWYGFVKEANIVGVMLLDEFTYDEESGRWTFFYEHELTKKRVTLETHGIHPMEAYEKRRIFQPRIYWDGSSSGGPEIDDWLTDGYKVAHMIVQESA
jgi:hypothetical protein